MDTVDGIDRGTARDRGIAKRLGLRFATPRCIEAMQSSHRFASTGTIVPLQEDSRPPLVRALAGTVCPRNALESLASNDPQSQLPRNESASLDWQTWRQRGGGNPPLARATGDNDATVRTRGIADGVCWTRLQIRLRPFIQLRAIHSSGKEYAKRLLSRSTPVSPFCASSRNRRFAVIHAASPCSLDSCESNRQPSQRRLSHDAILAAKERSAPFRW